MEKVFDWDEQRARNQFWALFVNSCLQAGLDDGEAINDDPWGGEIMSDVLHNMWPSNPLTPKDIEAIIQISGMVRAGDDGVYFHFKENVEVSKDIMMAISPYITDRAYYWGLASSHSAGRNSAEIFVDKCILDAEPYEKIRPKDLYDIYTTWCVLNHMKLMSSAAFKKVMLAQGYQILSHQYIKNPRYPKSYHSQTCYRVQILEEEVNKVVEQSGEAQEATSRTYRAEQIRDVNRSRAEVPTEIESAEKGNVPAASARKDDDRGSSGDDSSSVKDDEELVNYLPSENPEDADDVFGDSEDECDPEAEARALEELARLRERERIARDTKRCFKEMIFDYRARPNSFSREDFNDMMLGYDLDPSDEAFAQFLEFAHTK